MIRLAIAVGILSVFGFIAYVISVLLIERFTKKKRSKKNYYSQSKPNNNEQL